MRITGLNPQLKLIYNNYYDSIINSYLFYRYRDDSDGRESLQKALSEYKNYVSIPEFNTTKNTLTYPLEKMSEEKYYKALIGGRKENRENLLIANVSKVEAFFSDVLREVFRYYPERLSKDYNHERSIDTAILQKLYEIDDESTVFDILIEKKLEDMSYKTPSKFLKQFSEITRIPTVGEVFERYIEIKATRDLIVHNSNKINHAYISKAGKFKRGKLYEKIFINERHLQESIGIMIGCINYVYYNFSFIPKDENFLKEFLKKNKV